MNDRLSDNGRQLLRLASSEAQRLNHKSVCSGHFLLALVQYPSSRACVALEKMGFNLQRIREATESVLQCDVPTVAIDTLPQTPSAQKVIQYAHEEATRMGVNFVSMEHFLIGLYLETDGAAHQVLSLLGFELERAREAITEACKTPIQITVTEEGRRALTELMRLVRASNPSAAIAAGLIILRPQLASA